MREVQPKTYMIARPTLDWGEITQYMQDIGAPHFTFGNNAAEDLIEIGGRLCYRSWAPGMNVNVSKIRKDKGEYLANIVKSGHGSVLEHANFSFIFQNVSRVFTHELVRHRAGAAYSQESMRYVRLTDIPFWFPDWALSDSELMVHGINLLKQMENFQTWMADHFKLDDEGILFVEKKHKTSFMRRFAPEGVATAIMATFNVRTIRHIIAMRTNLGAEEEIRLVMDQLAELVVTELPNIMADYSRSENAEWIPEFLKV